MKYLLILALVIACLSLQAFDAAFLLTDTPRKTVFLAGELDINLISRESFDAGLDSMLFSGFNTAVEYRALMPFGTEVKMGYDAGLSAISGGIAYNYATLFFPVSSRSEIFYTYRRRAIDRHEFFTRETVLIKVIDYIKFYYQVMYSTGNADCGMSGGILLSIPFDFMYFEKMSISYENQFYSYDRGMSNKFIASLSMTTWGHQFSFFTSNFNTHYAYQYSANSSRYFFGMCIKRNFDF